MRPIQRPSLRSFALVALLALLWGSSYPMLKVAAESIPPLTLAAARALGGGLVLAVALGPNLPQVWRAAASGQGIWLQAAFNCIVPWTLVSWAAPRIDSSLMTILNSLSPIFVFLLTWGVTRHEVASPRKFAGVALGLTGVVAIVGANALGGLGQHTLAELACVAGSFAYGIAAVRGVRYHNVPPLVPAAGAVILAALFLVPLALATEGWPELPSTRATIALVALCVFPTGIAMVVYFRLLATIGSIATSSQAYLRILVGVGAGVLFLGEQLTPSMVLGLLLVFAGVLFMTLPDRRRIE